WRVTGSGTPRASSAGGPTATRAPADMINSTGRSGSTWTRSCEAIRRCRSGPRPIPRSLAVDPITEGSLVTRTSNRSRRLRPALAGLVATAVGAAGCTLPALAPRTDIDAEASAPGGTAVWRPCPEVPDEVVGRGAPGIRYDCARIQVPRDWAGGSGATAGPGE